MPRESLGADVSRRQLLGVAAAASGTAALGSVGSSGGSRSCSGVEYREVAVRPGDVSGPIADESYCSVERGVARRLGVEAGDQLRLGASDPSADARFPNQLFTVADVYRRGPKGIRANDADLEALGLDGAGEGLASGTVPHPCYETESAAKERGEFVELRRNETVDARLVVLAPHGDYVELGTGDQAEHAASRFDLPAWICYGANPGGGSYDRWHVSSTALDYDSFPELRRVAEVGHEAALSFHGRTYAGEPYVGVGGRATRLKRAVGHALRAAYEERGIGTTVCVHGRGSDCEQTGTDPDNVVNDVTASGDGGVQLEQPYSVREEHGALTARVAVRAILDALDSPDRQYGPVGGCPC